MVWQIMIKIHMEIVIILQILHDNHINDPNQNYYYLHNILFFPDHKAF